MKNIINAILVMFVVLYGSFARQPISNKIYKFINNKFFNVLMLIIIAYVGTHDILTSFILGMLFALVMYKVSENKINEYFYDNLHISKE